MEIKEMKEEEIKEVIKQCEENLNNCCEDYLRSYEEGVKDALMWVLGASEKPIFFND